MAQITTKRLPTTGVVIRAWRIFRGFSSTELAEKAGVRLGYLSEIEHDRKIRPDEDYLEKLANALHVPLKGILGRRMPLEKREDGKAEEEGKDTGGKEPGGVSLEVDRSNQGASAASTRLNSPLPTSHKEILMQRLEAAEKRVEEAEKTLQAAAESLQVAHEELREIGAFVGRMQDQE